MKVHVVEDEPALQRAAQLALAKAGHTVTTSNTGDKAFSDITKAKPEVVIMDLLLPGKGGMEVINELRDSHYDGGIVVFTNFDPKDIKQSEIKRLKISDILVKSSISLSELVEAVDKAIKKT